MKVRELMVEEVEMLAPDATVAETTARLRGGRRGVSVSNRNQLKMESVNLLYIRNIFVASCLCVSLLQARGE